MRISTWILSCQVPMMQTVFRRHRHLRHLRRVDSRCIRLIDWKSNPTSSSALQQRHIFTASPFQRIPHVHGYGMSLGGRRAFCSTPLAIEDMLARVGIKEGEDFDRIKRNLKKNEGNWEMGIAYLTEEMGIPYGMLKKLILWRSSVLCRDVETFWKPMMNFLVNDVGIDRKNIGKVVTSFPSFLTLSIEDNMKPKVEYLVNDVGIDRKNIGKVVTLLPQLFRLRIEENMKPKVEYLVNDVGMDRKNIGKVVTSLPQVFGLSIEDNMKPKVEYLVNDVGIDRKNIGDLVTSMPQVFCLNIEDTLKPRVEFMLEMEMTTSQSLASDMKRKCLKIFTYSLEQRIGPRFGLSGNWYSGVMGISDLEYSRKNEDQVINSFVNDDGFRDASYTQDILALANAERKRQFEAKQEKEMKPEKEEYVYGTWEDVTSPGGEDEMALLRWEVYKTHWWHGEGRKWLLKTRNGRKKYELLFG